MSFFRYRILGDEEDSDVLNVSVHIGRLGFFYGRWTDRNKWKEIKFNHGSWHFCSVDKTHTVYKFWYRLCYKSRFFEISMVKR